MPGMKPTQEELEENAKRLKEFFRSKEEDAVPWLAGTWDAASMHPLVPG